MPEKKDAAGGFDIDREKLAEVAKAFPRGSREFSVRVDGAEHKFGIFLDEDDGGVTTVEYHSDTIQIRLLFEWSAADLDEEEEPMGDWTLTYVKVLGPPAATAADDVEYAHYEPVYPDGKLVLLTPGEMLLARTPPPDPRE